MMGACKGLSEEWEPVEAPPHGAGPCRSGASRDRGAGPRRGAEGARSPPPGRNRGLRRSHRAIKVAPNDGFSHSILGIVFYMTARFDEAVSTLTRAATLDPNDPQTHNYLGIACSRKGWQQVAEQEVRKAIELNPNYGDAHFNLAVIYATQNPPAKEMARRHYKSAVQLGLPADPELEKLLK